MIIRILGTIMFLGTIIGGLFFFTGWKEGLMVIKIFIILAIVLLINFLGWYMLTEGHL